mgnify:CR=1
MAKTSYHCKSCKEEIFLEAGKKPEIINGYHRDEYCKECFEELALNKIPPTDENQKSPKSIGGANRDYHGGQFHTGEW